MVDWCIPELQTLQGQSQFAKEVHEPLQVRYFQIRQYYPKVGEEWIASGGRFLEI